jgi:hypothetical protein
MSESLGIQERRMTATLGPISEHDLYLRLFITNGGGW